MSNRKEIWLQIEYGEFHDIPRAFVVNWNGESYFFDCAFSGAIDDYPDEFIVYKLRQNISRNGNTLPWTELHTYGERVGSVRTQDVVFDESKRKAIRGDVFDTFVI
ncbi:MAG: hypothetical protein CAF45_004045 [Nitrospira sp. CG24E]|nr:MAG: hypothetical protein CAF45_004045 [Nitrospira sp. CG24E]